MKMKLNKYKAQCKPKLRKMFILSTRTLTIRNLKKSSDLDGLRSILDSGNCKILIIIHSQYPDVVLDILSEVAKSRNKLIEIYIDAWNLDLGRFMGLVRECVDAHHCTLERLTLKCRIPMDYLTTIFDFIPKTLKILDLSENTVTDSNFLGPLIRYIGSSHLEVVRFVNCKMKSDVLKELVKLILKIETPFSLKKVDGVDLCNCDEIPKCVRQSMSEPVKSIRRRQMNYKDYSVVKSCEISSHFMDYVRNVIFMKRLIGLDVRVWWPATKDCNRTSFSGRFWPAKILMVNPVDLIFVVKYDNEDIDHIPCKYVQPISPFKYGGGLTDNYIYYLTGSHGNVNRHLNTDKEPMYDISRESGPDTRSCRYYFRSRTKECSDLECVYSGGDSAKGVALTDRCYKKRSLEMVNDECLKTPEKTKSMSSSYSDLTKCSSTSSTIKYENEFVCRNCGFINTTDIGVIVDVVLDSVESKLGFDEKFKGNLLVPGEFCEFRDPLDQFRNDPSDYVGVVTRVNDSEPLYECICIYQDNEEIISVHSNDIRRTVVIPWYNWVDLVFRLILSNRKVFDGFVENSPYNTPKRHLTNSLNAHDYASYGTPSDTVATPVNKAARYSVDTSSSTASTPSQDISTCTSRETHFVNSSDTHFNVSGSIENTPKLNYVDNHDLKEDHSEETQEGKHREKLSEYDTEDYNILNNNFYYLFPVDLEDLTEYCPSNPLEMKLLTLHSYSKLVSSKINNHPKLHVDNTNSQMDVINLKLKSLIEFNDILQKELQRELDKNIELQSKFKCKLCFDTEINCVIDPCTHFSFCYKCANNLKTCPICRQRIDSLKILNLN